MGKIHDWYFGTNKVESRDEPKQETRAVGGPAAGVIPPARDTYPSITPDVALSIGAVYRSISILTSSVSQMELGVYRDGIQIKTPGIVKQPNLDESVTGFIEETVFSLAAYGNAYWRVYGDPAANIEILDPKSVTVTQDADTGRKHYYYINSEIPAKNIKHLRLMRRPGILLGAGPIQLATTEIRSALMLRDFASNWFSTSGVPTGLLTTDMTLGPEEAQAFSEAWKAFLVSQGGTAVLSQGMHYEYLGIKPAEAQFLEVQAAAVVNIARIFGIPAMHLLAEISGTSNTYLNLEQANMVFLQTTLVRYMTEIEEALSSLLPRGQNVQFIEEGLLRMDSVTKWNVIKTQVDVGYTSGNELRKNEGKAPLPTQAIVAKPNSNNEVTQNDESGN